MKNVLLVTAVLLIAHGARAVETGDTAPAIQALDQDGKSWTLDGHLGGKPLVVYFYPAAMTGGCTKQACAYRDSKQPDMPFEVVGISGDPVENLKWFQQAEQLNFSLLSDPDGTIAKAYGVPVKEGKKEITRTIDGKEQTLARAATAARWTFIISPEGKVIYKAEQVKPQEDLANVLQFLKKE